MEIRHFSPEDAASIQELVNLLQGHVAELDPFDRLRHSEDFDPARHFATVMDDVEKREGTVIVADDSGRIAGITIGAVIHQDEEYQMAHYPDKFGQIFEVCVHPDYRNQQVGQRLLASIENHLRSVGCEYVRLDCLATNEDAQRFYRKNGFKERNIQFMKKL